MCSWFSVPQPDSMLTHSIYKYILYFNVLMGHVMKPLVEAFFDQTTYTVTYVVYAGEGSACAVIDSVLDYDPKAGRTSTRSAEKVVEFVQAHALCVEWLLETHAHADHLSAAHYLKTRLG